tara:strand:- start:471 stop:2117 length:1647 start_codon:yes stop_codon:yes gene_type:complete
MAKIENTTVYPLVTPNADDFIIGTDTSDDNRTVSFSIEALTAAGGLQGLQSVLSTGYTAVSPMSLTGDLTVIGDIAPTTITAASSPGTSGQLLSSTATGILWVDSTAAQGLDSVLGVSNTATLDITMTDSDINSTGNIYMSGAAKVLSLSNSVDIDLALGSQITTQSNINLSGSTSVLNMGATASINDRDGSAGITGYVLTVAAAGGVKWDKLPPVSTPTLQEVLTSGNIATSNPISLVSSNLLLDSSSNIESDGANTFTGNNVFDATGTTASTSAIALRGSLYDGASTGSTDQVLTSTVTGVQWQDVSAVGVSSVEASPPSLATAALTPITITPLTGSVEVIQNIYNGGSLIGCVPEGGTNATFLRGDGSWVAPLQAPEWVTREPLTSNKVTFVGGSYYANVSPGSAGFPLSWAFELSASPAISALPDENFVTSLVASNIGNGACSSSYPNHQLCQATYNMVSDNADTYTFELWKVDLSGSVGVLAASVAIVAAANTMYAGDLGLNAGSGENVLEPGKGYIWTVRATAGGSVSSVYFNASFKWTGVA